MVIASYFLPAFNLQCDVSLSMVELLLLESTDISVLLNMYVYRRDLIKI